MKVATVKKIRNLCQLPELGISCWGCCGHSFSSKDDVSRSLKKNTVEYEKSVDKVKWANRSEYLRKSGICRNLIKKGDEIFCPLHPLRNDGQDLRTKHIGHSKIDCDMNYLCKTFYEFNVMDEETQKKFILFIKSKNPDWYTFSIKIDDGSYLKDFLES